MGRSVVTTWYGTFLVEGTETVRALLAPEEIEALEERVRARRSGHLTPEEESLLRDRGNEEWTTRDRRLADHGLRWDAEAPRTPAEPRESAGRGRLREAILRDADRALAASWDPSIHLQEAVRASADLERIRNLLGERLGSWVSRDVPDLDPGDHARVVAAAMDALATSHFGPVDPAVREARRKLAELYRAVESTRAELEKAVNASVPERTPNLVSLLGPELAARMLAQAGGLERLARLPASTVQVLGAEKAFFEHLRGHAPPPRHGLLFLHPSLQSAGRTERGKLARSLAGKVAIAARLDFSGAPLTPSLERSFAQRRDALRARRSNPPRQTRRGSSPPLHRASGDR